MHAYNDVPRVGEEKSRIERFSGSDIHPNLRHHHHFGVPVYVLDSSMQSGKKIPKWMPRARVGIYVGKSLRHARSVSLVLNPRTGLASPQYHCKYDDTFETVRGLREDSHGTWKENCGFSKASTTTKRTTTTTTSAKVPVELEDVQVPEVLNEVLDGTNEYQEDLLPPDIDVPEQTHEEHEGAPVLHPHEGANVPEPIVHGTRRSTRA
jgi:hypothetical protein